MTTYYVPIKIEPDGNACGKCTGLGTIPIATDYCRVFSERLSGVRIGLSGYTRCQACLNWEQQYLTTKETTTP